MSFRGLASGLVVAGAAALPASISATSVPVQLLHATARSGRVRIVALVTPGATPMEVEVSTARRLVGTGFLPKGLVLKEQIKALPDQSGNLRFSTKKRLRAGRYWVAVSVMDVGATSCVPIRFRGGGCLAEWSNVLPLRVR